MPFLLQQYSELILTLLKKHFKKNLFIFIDIFYPLGKPILLHLQQPRSVNNPGKIRAFQPHYIIIFSIKQLILL